MPSTEKLPILSEDEEEEGLCLDNAESIQLETDERMNESGMALVVDDSNLKEIDPPPEITSGGIPIRGYLGGEYVLMGRHDGGSRSVEDIRPR